jgi:hypothetical protein
MPPNNEHPSDFDAGVNLSTTDVSTMPRFRVGDHVILIERYAGLYPSGHGVVVQHVPDSLRAMFDEFVVEFEPGSQAAVLDFQLGSDISRLPVSKAVVALDTYADEVPAQTRGIQRSNRILLFKAETLDIHIEVVETGEITTLLGQVLEKRSIRFLPDVEIRLVKTEATIDVQDSNALGEFRFPSVPKGPLVIEILLRAQRQRIVGEFLV